MFFLNCLLLICSFLKEDEDIKKVEIGGPRKVSANIKKIEDKFFQVEVRLIPVKCFDSTTNRHISFEKAQFYGLQALAMSLTAGKKMNAIIKNVQVIESKNDNSFFVIVLQIPINGVSLTEIGTESQKDLLGKKQIKDESLSLQLITPKEDYLNTLGILEKSFNTMPRFEKNLNKFYNDIALAEEKLSVFSSLRNEIKLERFWLNNEKDELIEKINKVEEKLLNELHNLVEKSKTIITNEK